MPDETPALLREEGLDVIADWLRDLSAENRSALTRLLVNDATNSDADPTLTGLGRALAPVLMRMDLGDDPRPLLPQSLGYGGGLTEVELRRALDALLGKAMVDHDAAALLRTIDADELPEYADALHESAADPEIPVNERQRRERVALVLDAMARGVDPLVAFESLADTGRTDGADEG